MFVSKAFVVIFALCLVHQSVSKPTNENVLTEGRGFMSTIWGWITYPFSWWSSKEPEQPITEQLVGSTTIAPNDIIQIGDRNVTIWCNDQTCTTMKCHKTECRNITCNLYDTDLRGECREYNIIPDEPVEHSVPNLTEPITKVPIQNLTAEIVTPELNAEVSNNSNIKDNSAIVEEHPLELEAVLSSTVNNQNIDKHLESLEEIVPEQKE